MEKLDVLNNLRPPPAPVSSRAIAVQNGSNGALANILQSMAIAKLEFKAQEPLALYNWKGMLQELTQAFQVIIYFMSWA